MKKLIIVIIAFLPCLMSAQERFMLIADPHVLPQSIIEADTAFDTYMTKQRKMFDLSEAIWTALMDTATKYHPEVLLIPGDLTRSAEPEGHALINASLRRLREQGIQTLVIPGNDDRPDEIGWDSAYSWLYGNVLSRDPNSYSYAAEPVSGVTVIGLDGTNGRSGTGRISNETMTWALAQTDSAVAKGHTVLVMSHWQILEHFDKKGMLEPTCRMTYADAIRDSLMHHGAQVLITGHFHVNGITTWYDTIPGSNDSIVEITTGSPITYPCPYRWLTVSEDRHEIAVESATITTLDTITDMHAYSREWQREHTANWLPALSLRAWKKVDDYWSYAASLLGADIAAYLKEALPKTDSDRVAITEKYFGSTAVEMYLLHSDGNEYTYPQADSLANEVYEGMADMIAEICSSNIFLVIIQNSLTLMAQSIAEEPVQSLVEDITQWRSDTYNNRTDDLHTVLRLGRAPRQGLQPLVISSSVDKYLQDGQVRIRTAEQVYTLQGQPLQ